MPGTSEPSSATKPYVVLDWNEFALGNSVEGRRATLIRLAAEARERNDDVSLQRIQADMQQLEAELQRLEAADVASASQRMMNVPGGYMPPAPVQIQQQPQPSMTGNVLQVPHVPRPPAPSNIVPPMPMASGTGPVPGSAHQGPNRRPTPYEEARAKRKRNRRSDRGQPKPRRPRKSASSSESASQRRGTQSLAHTQEPVEQVGATLPPSNEETSGKELRRDSFLGENTPAVVQGFVPDDLIDPALWALGAGNQPSQTIAARPAAGPAAIARDNAFVQQQQQQQQGRIHASQEASNFVSPYAGYAHAAALQNAQDPFGQQPEVPQQSLGASNGGISFGEDLPADAQSDMQRSFDLSLEGAMSALLHNIPSNFDFDNYPAAEVPQDFGLDLDWDSTQQGSGSDLTVDWNALSTAFAADDQPGNLNVSTDAYKQA